MARQSLQVLVIPFRKTGNSFEFCVFKRSDENYWQFVAGGAESHETPLEAAKREAQEEGGIPLGSQIIELDSMCCVPANIFRDWEQWPRGTYVVKEMAFAVDASGVQIILSNEHKKYQWLSFEEAMGLLRWDSNRTALWELSRRLGMAL